MVAATQTKPTTPQTQQQKPVTSAPSASPSRMTLGAVKRGPQEKPIVALLYGVEGIGKSSFGASAPNPIFIDVEGGISHLDVAHFPRATSWQDVKDAVRVLTQEQHDYKTVVIDTLDHAEPMLWDHICKRDNKKSLEGYGYGRGPGVALDEWRSFWAGVERLVSTKNMNVVLLAHAKVRNFKNPTGDDYERYQLKMNDLASSFLKERVDHLLFARYEISTNKEQGALRAKAYSSGARFLFTRETAGYDAKSRSVTPIPAVLPLSWDEFAQALQQGQSPEALTAAITSGAERLDEELRKAAAGAIQRAKGDATKLAQLLSWVETKLAELPPADAAPETETTEQQQ